jgi:hypothetical protein
VSESFPTRLSDDLWPQYLCTSGVNGVGKHVSLLAMQRWALVSHGCVTPVVPGVLAVFADAEEARLEPAVAPGG